MFRLRLKPVEQWLSALVAMDTSYWRHHLPVQGENLLLYTKGGGETQLILLVHIILTPYIKYTNTYLSTIPTSNSKLYR